ncbi:aminotransferase class V-fold PLP-dependent enzyme [Tunicatimonas pelagia]|uniref:aminotransferase class V-fold PLP-dependent enzyme n=1 Tax=Tunicatimonas pelagia TaxID=931531 RepID=UPI0026657301|nr:cysteine desulfurase [Tunicatimonas pelagia]WKN43495.1 cysteine desulfurase [Tunicatimonas pelagia]
MVESKKLLNDPTDIKQQFSIFSEFPELVYLDNAATTQRPQSVINRVNNFHQRENASIRRGVYRLSARAAQEFEAARSAVAKFFRAPQENCIAFTQGATESVNIVARSIIEATLKPGDNVVVSLMEHHANLIPWQMLCQANGAELRIIPVSELGDLDLSELDTLIDARTAIVAVVHISNTLGTINPVEKIIAAAHQREVPVLVDAAQSAALYPIDLTNLDCDFMVCSAHKMFGSFGVGILYVHPRYHRQVQPYNYGGGIIRSVTVKETEFLSYPYLLEAGTPNVAGVIGLAEAIRFIETLDRTSLVKQLHQLTNDARQKLASVEGLSLLGNPALSSSLLSFSLDGMHPHDIASFLNEDHIAVRAGQHCTQPLLDHLGVPATVRVSLSIYNTPSDIDKLVGSMQAMKSFWT